MLVYISFDTVPAPKGAATHIEAFAIALSRAFGDVELGTASPAITAQQRIERWPGVFHTELPALGVSLVDRVLCFRRYLQRWLAARPCEAVQFRSIFEGMPLLDLKPRPRLIFEVNGLPSIELKYRYPDAVDDRQLTHKLIAQERACIAAADAIVTPSAVTAQYLAAERGANASQIRVIPNGVFAGANLPVPAQPQSLDLLYFGTLAAWQGVELGIRAIAQIGEQAPVRLVIIGPGSARQVEGFESLAAKLGIASRIEILPPVDRGALLERIRNSFAVLAPLAAIDRNVAQGCCPLKILEGMAAGVPVIASDLAVVREVGEDGRHLLLVKPGSVDQIAEAVLSLVRDPQRWRDVAAGGQAHAFANYTWERSGGQLAALWRELGITRASTPASACCS